MPMVTSIMCVEEDTSANEGKRQKERDKNWIGGNESSERWVHVKGEIDDYNI